MILRVDFETIEGQLRFLRRAPGELVLPVTNEIPNRSQVIAIHWDFYSACVLLMVWHPLFCVVQHGEQIPYMLDHIPVERISIKGD